MEAAPFCVLDVETAGGTWESFPDGFQILLVGVRDRAAHRMFTAEPESLAQLAAYLDGFNGVVVTYNGTGFDLPLIDRDLRRVLGRPLRVAHHYDLLREVEQLAGYRIGLDRLAQYTLGAGKVPWDHRQNARSFDEEPHRLVDYNRVDLDLTYELFERVAHGLPLFLGNTTVTLAPPHAPTSAGPGPGAPSNTIHVTMTASPAEGRVPERQRLEAAFVRARWLAAIALAVGAPLAGMHVAAGLALAAVYVCGNGAAWYVNARLRTLAAQRRLGIGAVTLDVAVVLGAALAVPADAATAFYGALVLVAAEAAVRYAPPKDVAASALIVAALGAIMGVRDGLREEPLRLLPFALWSALIIGAGFVIGSAVREVYRQAAVRPHPTPLSAAAPAAPSPGPGALALTGEVLAALTPRERQVLTLIAQGYSNQRIAEALIIEQKTVKNHINNMYAKLNIHSRYEAITRTLAQRREPPRTRPQGEDAHAQSRL